MFLFAVGVPTLNKTEQCTGTKRTKQHVLLHVPLALKIVTGIFLNCQRMKTRKEDSDVGSAALNRPREMGGGSLYVYLPK
jgi:hypothetical protein